MKFEENRETYSKIATLYYLGELPQDKIASMFHISRFKVSRILKKCRDLRIIEFHIKSPLYYEKLGEQIKSALGIGAVIIVPSGSTQDDSKANVGHAAAKYLDTHLKDGMNAGFDWGTTLQAMAREFHPGKAYPNSLFLQISGSIASQSALSLGYMDGHDIVKTLATKAGAGWSLFPAPYIVQSKLLRDMLLQEPSIKKHVDLFPCIDIAFFGVGSALAETRLPFYRNYLSKEESGQLALPPGCGEIFSTLLSLDGEAIPSILTGRVMTIDLPVLKQIPLVVALATGSGKTHSLVAGANGGYFHTMIIDEIAALSLVDFFENGA